MRTDRDQGGIFSETEAQQILARAAEIEAKRGTEFTIEDLRQIAARAGIEAHALEHAIAERGAVDGPNADREIGTAMPSRDIAMLAVTGAALGALAIVADNVSPLGNNPVTVFGPSGLLVMYRALRHPVKQGFPGLLRELGVFFGSFTAVVAASGGIDAASIAVTWSVLAGALSCAILSLRGARSGVTASDVT